MIKTMTNVVSESGKELKSDGGFIIQGNIYTAHIDKDGYPDEGLVGGDKNVTRELRNLEYRGERLSTVLSKLELLKALGYTPEELEICISKMRLPDIPGTNSR